MENRTGSLAKVLERLAEEHINVEYAYASTMASPGKAMGIFHTSNPKRAAQILNESTGPATPVGSLGGAATAPLSLNRRDRSGQVGSDP